MLVHHLLAFLLTCSPCQQYCCVGFNIYILPNGHGCWQYVYTCLQLYNKYYMVMLGHENVAVNYVLVAVSIDATTSLQHINEFNSLSWANYTSKLFCHH